MTETIDLEKYTELCEQYEATRTQIQGLGETLQALGQRLSQAIKRDNGNQHQQFLVEHLNRGDLKLLNVDLQALAGLLEKAETLRKESHQAYRAFSGKAQKYVKPPPV